VGVGSVESCTWKTAGVDCQSFVRDVLPAYDPAKLWLAIRVGIGRKGS
jgi:hypothetical protein